MVNIIYGTNRSGKTDHIYGRISQDIEKGCAVLLLVPEQTVLDTERALSGRGIVSLDLQVVSFRRLSNLIFRRYGGLCYNYISKAGKHIVMWRAVSELAPMLKKYSEASDRESGLLTLLLSAIEEFIMNGITPDMLTEAAEKTNDTELSETLESLSQIYALYSHILHEGYDDPSEDITIAAQKVRGRDFFEGYSVYVDGFSGFTEDQYLLLEEIIRQSDSLIVTLGYEKGDRREHFERLRRSDRAIRYRASNAGKKVLDEHFDQPLTSAEMTCVAERLWDFAAEKYAGGPEHLRILRCRDARSEALTVASEIKKQVIDGARYRDFTVVVRNISDYRSVLRPAFEKCGVPFFMSGRTDIKSKSQTRLLLSCLAIKVYNWQSDDLLTYIKSGLCRLSDEDADILSEYILMWKISGKRWYDADDWRMNPQGFGEEYTESVYDKLAVINRARNTVREPLIAFFEAFDSQTTVTDACRATVAFMKSIDLQQKIVEGADAKRREGRASEADEDMQLWNGIINALEVLSSLAGDMKIDVEQYMGLLTLMLEGADIGKIPPGTDEVTVVSADMYRSSSTRYVYIPGVNEKVFPASASSYSLLKEKDREKLEEIGISVVKSPDEQIADELLYFYNAITSAAERATVLFNDNSGASVGVFALTNIFGDLEIEDKTAPAGVSRVCSPMTAFEYAASDPGREDMAGIVSYLSEKEERFRAASECLKTPLVTSDCTVGSEITERLTENGMKLSQSKIDTYVSCPFSYFCKYVVNLHEAGSGEVESRNVGNYVHKILELFFIEVQGRDMSRLSQEEVDEISSRVIEKCKVEVLGGDTSARTLCLFERLTSLSKLMINNLVAEFAQSEFRPTLFEYPIDIGGGIPSIPMVLEDGTRVHMRGYIDRVDTFVSGDDVYVRVVDYKTGSKTFSMSDIEKGLNLQMLIYLFTLCACDDEQFKKSIGVAKDRRALPAGVLYYLASTPDIKSDDGNVIKGEQALDLIMKHISRKGLLIDDIGVLRAMERDLEGVYIPVAVKKDGDLTANSSVASKETFAELRQTVLSKIVGVAEDINRGRADANPLVDKYNDACKYCAMKSLCRRNKEGGGDDGED